MARLWLLTDHYPFGTGETFVAAELAYFAAHGVAVHIVPTGRAALAFGTTPRAVPGGVIVRHDIAQALRRARQRPRAALRWHLAQRRWPRAQHAAHLAQELMRLWRLSPDAMQHNVKRFCQATAHALLLAYVMADCVDPPEHEDGIYSFWLGASALGMHLAYPQVPMVSRAHGHDLFASRHLGGYLPWQPELIAALQILYCISDDGAAYAQREFADNKARILMMPLGVKQTPLRARMSTDGVLRVMSCARLVPIKRIDLWIRALHHVRTPLLWTHLGDGPEKSALVRACHSLPEHIRVTWAGEVHHDAVRTRLTQGPVDVFVNTSRHEGRPVSIMEALSVGLPVRAADVGGTSELVPKAWLHPAAADPKAIGACVDAFAALPAGVRAAEAQMALLAWQTHANAEHLYPGFVKHVARALGLASSKAAAP